MSDDLVVNTGAFPTLRFGFRCRWCGKEYNSDSSEASCPGCSAVQQPVIAFTNSNSDQSSVVRFWHNPDNSLFLEFVRSEKDSHGALRITRAARYTASAEMLRENGLLTEFAQWDPEGKR